MFTIEKIHRDEDDPVCALKATSFPDGVGEAFRNLHGLLSQGHHRKTFGISYPDHDGKIQYWAACPEHYPDEAKRLGLDFFLLTKGDYLCVEIKNFRENMSDIGRAFKKLVADNRIDPFGFCLEEYINEHDVLCMVKCR